MSFQRLGVSPKDNGTPLEDFTQGNKGESHDQICAFESLFATMPRVEWRKAILEDESLVRRASL